MNSGGEQIAAKLPSSVKVTAPVADGFIIADGVVSLQQALIDRKTI